MIKEITAKTLEKKKTGWRFDRKRRLFITFQVDATFNGSRHVRRGFLTRRDAKEYLEQLKTQERLIKIGYVEAMKTIEKLTAK